MSSDLIALVLNSPVIVGLLAFISGIIPIISKKPESQKKIEKAAKDQKFDDEHQEMLMITRNLDRHINNNSTPFRAQINDKLDSLTTMVEASLEAQKSTNTSIKMIDTRVTTIESEVEGLKHKVSESDED